MKSTAANVKVEIQNLTLENGLLIDNVTLTGKNLEYDPISQRINVPEPGKLVAQLSAASVYRFLETNPPENVKDLDVMLGEGVIVVTAKVQSLISVGIEATGKLVAANGAMIEFLPTSVRVAGFGAPSRLVESVLSQINPLLDLSDLPIPITVTSIEVRPDGITIAADAGPF